MLVVNLERTTRGNDGDVIGDVWNGILGSVWDVRPEDMLVKFGPLSVDMV